MNKVTRENDCDIAASGSPGTTVTRGFRVVGLPEVEGDLGVSLLFSVHDLRMVSLRLMQS